MLVDLGIKESYEVLLKGKNPPIVGKKCLFEKVHNKFYQEMIVGGLSILNTVYNPSNDIERAGTCSWWERRLLAK